MRLIPILGLILATLPVMALASLLGGIDPSALFGLFQVAIGCALVGCSLALVLSIYGRKTHEVVMMAYVIILFWIMAPVFMDMVVMPPEWLLMIRDGAYHANPYVLAFATYDEPTPPGETRYMGFLAGCLGGSALLIGLATARVRRVALKASGRGVKAR